MSQDQDQPLGLCLLHADYHAMQQECWAAILDWQADRWDVALDLRAAAYHAEVEHRMLAEIRLGQAVDHAVPAPIDRAIRRDHSLCGAEPCSDCR